MWAAEKELDWECELGGFLEEIGLRRGQASTCLYFEEARGISASKDSRDDAEWLIRKFKERYEIKTQTTGEAAGLDKQLQILNRTVRWSSRGFWIEADPRHVKDVIKALGLEGASPAPAPGGAAKGETRSKRTMAASTPTWRMRRPPCSARSRRGVPIPARHYVRHDEAVLKDVSAGRTRLEEHEESGTVLAGRSQVGCLFECQAHQSTLHALADVDWAGDRQSIKSVSGGMILHGKHLIKAWTKQQSSVATSTAEAELYAGNRAATESMEFRRLPKTGVESSRFDCTLIPVRHCP